MSRFTPPTLSQEDVSSARAKRKQQKKTQSNAKPSAQSRAEEASLQREQAASNLMFAQKASQDQAVVLISLLDEFIPPNMKPSVLDEVNVWVRRLAKAVPPAYETVVKKSVYDSVTRSSIVYDKSFVTLLMEYYRSHPHVKSASEAWSKEVTGMTYKVNPRAGKFRTDDEIYGNDPYLMKLLPRGCTLVRKNPVDDHRTLVSSDQGHVCAVGISGNPKFFGLTRSDNDEDGGGGEVDAKVASSEMEGEQKTAFFVTRKVNGAACHVSLCPLSSEWWIVGGKIRKIRVRNLQDIAHFSSQRDYAVASSAAVCFFKLLDTMKASKVNKLRRFLELTRWTLSFEFTSDVSQHIVLLPKGQTLTLIGCCGIHLQSHGMTHPLVGFGLASYFGLRSVIDKNNPRAFDQTLDMGRVIEAVRESWESEGVVLVKMSNAAEVVGDEPICMIKVKSWWYVILRAIREQIRKLIDSKLQLFDVQKGIAARLAEFYEKGHVSSASYTSTFTSLGMLFAEWVNRLPMRDRANFIALYPVHWREFLTQQQLPLTSDVLSMDVSSLSLKASVPPSHSTPREELPLLILMQGLPGIGKSYFAQALMVALNERGVSCCEVSQDQFVLTVGAAQARSACIDRVKSLLDPESNTRVVILARNNGVYGRGTNYDAYLEMERDRMCRIIFIAPKELQTRLLDIAWVSVASALYRKKNDQAQQHPNSRLSDTLLATTSLKFVPGYCKRPGSIEVNFLEVDQQPMIPNTQLFGKLLAIYTKQEKRASDICTADFERLQLHDKLVIRSAIECRRPVGAIVQDSLKRIMPLLHLPIPETDSLYAVRLDAASREKVGVCLHGLVGIDPKWRPRCDHVTFMHSSDYTLPGLPHVDVWNILAHYAAKGVKVTVTPLEYLVTNRLVALKVSCAITSTTNVVGVVDYLVVSNVPHVTMAVCKGVSPVESISALKYNMCTIAEEWPVLTGTMEKIY